MAIKSDAGALKDETEARYKELDIGGVHGQMFGDFKRPGIWFKGTRSCTTLFTL